MPIDPNHEINENDLDAPIVGVVPPSAGISGVDDVDFVDEYIPTVQTSAVTRPAPRTMEELNQQMEESNNLPSSEVLGRGDITDPNVPIKTANTNHVVSTVEGVVDVTPNTLESSIRDKEVRIREMQERMQNKQKELNELKAMAQNSQPVQPVQQAAPQPVVDTELKERMDNWTATVQQYAEKAQHASAKPAAAVTQAEEEDAGIVVVGNNSKPVEAPVEIKVVPQTKPVESPVRKQAVAQPIAQEPDDFVDLNLSTTQVEEVQNTDVPVEDLFAMDVFDANTSSTKETEQEVTPIVVPNFNAETFEKIVEHLGEIEESGSLEEKRNIRIKTSNPKSVESRVTRSSLFNSERRDAEQEALSEAFEAQHEIAQSKTIDSVTYKDSKSAKTQLNRIENGAVISSNDTFALTMALLGGIRKIYFYNSGFWAVVRPPLLSELHTYYTRCYTESATYGRLFGRLAYMPADIEISRAGLELFKKCIVQCNLENYRVDNVLERNLSSLDENTYLWGLASLMYPDGTDIEYVCVNNKCTYVDRTKVDIAKMRYNDYTRLGVDALKYCHSSETRTEADIENYKENILKHSAHYTLDNEWGVKLAEPSLYDALEFKSTFVSELSDVLELSAFDSIDQYVATRYFKLLSPWVKMLTYTNQADGKKIYMKEGLQDAVDALQLKYTDLPDLVAKHTKTTKTSYFCYSYNACPRCNQVPSSVVGSGLIPCDMQQSFFSLTTGRLV